MNDLEDKEAGSHPGSASRAISKLYDRRALLLIAWNTTPAACWTPDKDNAIASCRVEISKQVGGLGQ